MNFFLYFEECFQPLHVIACPKEVVLCLDWELRMDVVIGECTELRDLSAQRGQFSELCVFSWINPS